MLIFYIFAFVSFYTSWFTLTFNRERIEDEIRQNMVQKIKLISNAGLKLPEIVQVFTTLGQNKNKNILLTELLTDNNDCKIEIKLAAIGFHDSYNYLSPVWNKYKLQVISASIRKNDFQDNDLDSRVSSNKSAPTPIPFVIAYLRQHNNDVKKNSQVDSVEVLTQKIKSKYPYETTIALHTCRN